MTPTPERTEKEDGGAARIDWHQADMDAFLDAHSAFHASCNPHTQFELTAARIIGRHRERAMAEAVDCLRRLELRLTAVANAFYVSGKRSDLKAALDGWKGDAHNARTIIRDSIQ